jgi:hypothetical protein
MFDQTIYLTVTYVHIVHTVIIVILNETRTLFKIHEFTFVFMLKLKIPIAERPLLLQIKI